VVNAEITFPLSRSTACYCYNPVDYARFGRLKLTTDEWIRAFRQAREMGASSAR
jgi:hypothetical protein